MPQHDYNIANQTGAGLRSDMNDVLLAIASFNSGPSEPAARFPYQPWADTTLGQLKIRNAANNAWVVVGQLGTQFLGLAPTASPTFSGLATFEGDILLSGTGYLDLPSGTTVQRPATPVNGMVRYNTTLSQVEAYAASAWQQVSLDLSNRNRIVNGGMVVDQRNSGAFQAFTAGGALAYCIDQWYAYCTGANVNGQRVQGASVGQFAYQFTGATGVTSIGFGQRIEQLNTADLASGQAILSVEMSNSLLTSVTWAAYYATTADSFGTLASPTRTQIATGTLNVTSTITRFFITLSVPAAATTGLEIVFSVGAQIAGTWVIRDVQLEKSQSATPFERRSVQHEINLCQRYYEIIEPIAVMFPWSSATADIRASVNFKATKRDTPSITLGTKTSGSGSLSAVTTNTNGVVFSGNGSAQDTVIYTGTTASAVL